MSLIDEASLVQIPSGYKEDKLYSIIPSDGTGDFNFSRASTATRVNDSGLIETVAIDTPRIDYTGGGCGSLLLEPQRTNSITYSEDLSSLWNFTNVDKTLTQVKNPSGNLGVYEIAANSTSGSHYFEPSTYSATSGADYTFSFFAKINGSNFVQVALSTGFSSLYQNFNLLDGTLGNGNLTSGYSSSIEPFGNGWYKVSIKGTTISANARFLTIPIITDIASRNPSFNGDGTSGVYVWGFQREQGSYPTSYIPTSGSTVTRVKDTSLTTGLSSLINSVEGTIFVEMAALANDSTNRYISINNSTSTKRIILKFGTSSNNISALGLGTANSFNMSYSGATITNMNRIALKYKANDCALWVNGVEVATDTTFTAYAASTLSHIAFSNFSGGGQWLEANVQNLMFFPSALSNSELAELTTL